VNSITIGDFVTIGDRAMIHCTSKHATTIGDRAIVGSGAICHGCTIEVESVVGVGAQVMDGAVISKHSMVGPGSLVSPGKVIPTGQLWSGVPAVFERDLTEEEIQSIYSTGEETAECAVLHAVEADKTWQMIEMEEYDDEQITTRSPTYYKRLTEEVINDFAFPRKRNNLLITTNMIFVC
jgi:gamma-carbonic anhydrase